MALLLLPLSDAESGVAERNNFLTQMLSLAEKSGLYFVINMEENKVQLMSKGIVLREWTADKMTFISGYLPLQTFTLEKKSIQLDKLRHAEPIEKDDTATDTNAGDNKTDGKPKSTYIPAPALDIEDMPSDYQLSLKGGVSINVIAGTESNLSVMKRYLVAPLCALWPSSKKDGAARMAVYFKDRTNSQALFWAFREGTECIIVPPGSGDKNDLRF